MKKKILLLFALIVSITGAYANNGTLSIQNIRNVIPGYSGTTYYGSFDIVLSDADVTYCAVNFNIAMPAGLNLIKYDTANDVYGKKGPLLSNHTQSVTDHGTYWTFIIESASVANFSATNGTLLTLYFTVDANASGTPEGSISSIVMSDNQGTGYNLSDINYSVPVDNTLFLDENDDYTPEAFTGINVHVNRALEANKWSTIVLPFAMTDDQVTETFGANTRIGYFKGMTGGTNNLTKVTFEDKTAIDAHTPYIIKVSTAKPNGFTANNVNITVFAGNYDAGNRLIADKNDEPIYEGPAVVYGEMAYNSKKDYWYYDDETSNDMIGTYKPMTMPKYYLFLNNNTFVFSTGKSKLKGFRACFYNYDVDYSSNSRQFIINFDDDSETTGVEVQKNVAPNDCTYSLTGQLVKNPAKGIYINNGKKVIIK